MKQLYLIRFKWNGEFSGYNSVRAENIVEAKELMKKQFGSAYHDINWPTLMIGDEAERELVQLEREFGSLFY